MPLAEVTSSRSLVRTRRSAKNTELRLEDVIDRLWEAVQLGKNEEELAMAIVESLPLPPKPSMISTVHGVARKFHSCVKTVEDYIKDWNRMIDAVLLANVRSVMPPRLDDLTIWMSPAWKEAKETLKSERERIATEASFPLHIRLATESIQPPQSAMCDKYELQRWVVSAINDLAWQLARAIIQSLTTGVHQHEFGVIISDTNNRTCEYAYFERILEANVAKDSYSITRRKQATIHSLVKVKIGTLKKPIWDLHKQGRLIRNAAPAFLKHSPLVSVHSGDQICGSIVKEHDRSTQQYTVTAKRKVHSDPAIAFGSSIVLHGWEL